MLDAAQEPEKFAVLRKPQRIWAVSPVHGDMARLRALHAFIEPQFAPGDRLVRELAAIDGIDETQATQRLHQVLKAA